MKLYHAYNDFDLAELLSAGDEKAFAEIFNRYNQKLFIYAFNRLHNEEEAKDVVQDIFVNLWNKRSGYALNTTLTGYLYTSVRNKAFDLFAHKKIESKYVDSLQHFISLENSSTDYLVREKEISGLVEREIMALPVKMREVFELSRKEHLSHKQIAEKLNLSEHTVSKQIKKALKILRVRLGLVIYLLVIFKI